MFALTMNFVSREYFRSTPLVFHFPRSHILRLSTYLILHISHPPPPTPSPTPFPSSSTSSTSLNLPPHQACAQMHLPVQMRHLHLHLIALWCMHLHLHLIHPHLHLHLIGIKCIWLESNAKQIMRIKWDCCSIMFIFLVAFVGNKHQEDQYENFDCSVWKS